MLRRRLDGFAYGSLHLATPSRTSPAAARVPFFRDRSSIGRIADACLPCLGPLDLALDFIAFCLRLVVARAGKNESA